MEKFSHALAHLSKPTKAQIDEFRDQAVKLSTDSDSATRLATAIMQQLASASVPGPVLGVLDAIMMDNRDASHFLQQKLRAALSVGFKAVPKKASVQKQCLSVARNWLNQSRIDQTTFADLKRAIEQKNDESSKEGPTTTAQPPAPHLVASASIDQQPSLLAEEAQQKASLLNAALQLLKELPPNKRATFVTLIEQQCGASGVIDWADMAKDPQFGAKLDVIIQQMRIEVNKYHTTSMKGDTKFQDSKFGRHAAGISRLMEITSKKADVADDEDDKLGATSRVIQYHPRKVNAFLQCDVRQSLAFRPGGEIPRHANINNVNPPRSLAHMRSPFVLPNHLSNRPGGDLTELLKQKPKATAMRAWGIQPTEWIRTKDFSKVKFFEPLGSVNQGSGVEDAVATVGSKRKRSGTESASSF